eukprot:Sdes_comp20328_c0_seq2m14011
MRKFYHHFEPQQRKNSPYQSTQIQQISLLNWKFTHHKVAYCEFGYSSLVLGIDSKAEDKVLFEHFVYFFRAFLFLFPLLAEKCASNDPKKQKLEFHLVESFFALLLARISTCSAPETPLNPSHFPSTLISQDPLLVLQTLATQIIEGLQSISGSLGGCVSLKQALLFSSLDKDTTDWILTKYHCEQQEAVSSFCVPVSVSQLEVSAFPVPFFCLKIDKKSDSAILVGKSCGSVQMTVLFHWRDSQIPPQYFPLVSYMESSLWRLSLSQVVISLNHCW